MSFRLQIPGWQVAIDTSPEWWFVRIEGNAAGSLDGGGFVDQLWERAERENITRFVVELSESAMLTSLLVGQLIQLHKRAHLAGGVARICNWGDEHYDSLSLLRVADRFPNYDSREAAVLGRLPATEEP